MHSNIKIEKFTVLNCSRCDYAANFDVAAKYSGRRGHSSFYNTVTETFKTLIYYGCSFGCGNICLIFYF